MVKLMLVAIFMAILAACSPTETFTLIDSSDVTGFSQIDNPHDENEENQNNRLNAQPLWISELKMFTRLSGWALDDLGRILRTIDGVELWRDVSPAQPDSKTYITTAFLNSDRAVVVYYTPDTDKFESWITEDGGNFWIQGSPLPNGSPGLITPVELFFINNQHGWFAAQFNGGIERIETVIYETRDGGLTWELAHLSLPQNGSTPDSGLPGSLVLPHRDLLVFTTPSRGFAGNGSLYQTRDGGKNWEPVLLEFLDTSLITGNPYIHVFPPSFFNSSEGSLMMTIFNLDQVGDIQGEGLPAPPIANYLFFTEDGGDSWIEKDAPALIGRSHFITPDSGWFLGKDDASPAVTPRLYKTTDRGSTWHIVNEALPLPLGTQLVFINESEGFAYNFYASREQNLYQSFDDRADTVPYLYQTINGGESWTAIEPFLAIKTDKIPKNP